MLLSKYLFLVWDLIFRGEIQVPTTFHRFDTESIYPTLTNLRCDKLSVNFRGKMLDVWGTDSFHGNSELTDAIDFHLPERTLGDL